MAASASTSRIPSRMRPCGFQAAARVIFLFGQAALRDFLMYVDKAFPEDSKVFEPRVPLHVLL